MEIIKTTEMMLTLNELDKCENIMMNRMDDDDDVDGNLRASSPCLSMRFECCFRQLEERERQ